MRRRMNEGGVTHRCGASTGDDTERDRESKKL
jgi:hypothetical protein